MDRVKSSSVVSGHDDVDLAEGKTVVLEIVGSAGCGRVAHVSEVVLSGV
jgi:hypothetical protein